MRLPADRRYVFETACRAAALGVLMFVIWRLFFPPASSQGNDTTLVAEISTLSDLTREPTPPNRLHFALPATPSSRERAWLNALRATGSLIQWNGKLTPLAISLRPIPAPAGGHVALVSAPSAIKLTFRDDISIIDSAQNSSGLSTFPFAIAFGNLRAVAGSDSAWAAAGDSVALRRLLIFGKAGWETKFVAGALEEDGWKVDAVVSVAPSIYVTQGTALPVDTAHYSAVIALDESATSRAREINLFVRAGGGVVLGEAAARSAAFTSLRATRDAASPPRRSSLSDTVTRASTPFTPLHLLADAVPIELKLGDVAVAARRIEFGRAIQIAYPETWRWRLQGFGNPIADHRSWWSGVVGQVAYAPRVEAVNSAKDPAPLADLVAIAGKSVNERPNATPFASRSNPMLWMIALFALLTIEWASRRLRGAR